MAQSKTEQPPSSNSAMARISKPHPRAPTCSPNVLPCRIHHSGRVNACTRYWDPKTEADGTRTAYFRGRKLRGKAIRLPEGYRGVVLKKLDVVDAPATAPQSYDDADCDLLSDVEEVETTTTEEIAVFEDVTVWGHDIVPDDAENPYARGIEEWIEFAQAIHNWEPTPVETHKGTETLEHASSR